MATPSVLEPQKQPRHIFARRFLDLVIPPPKIKQPTMPNLYDTQNLAIFFYTELSEISEILPNALYLSGCSPVTGDNLKSLGVTAVVCALSENEQRRMMADRTLPDDVKIMYARLLDSDSSDISEFFDTTGRFIDEEINKGGRVLVHCAAGISRSSTLILAYLMKYRNFDLRTAFNRVKNARRVVRPNNGFFQKLIDYERSVFRERAAAVDQPQGEQHVRIPSVRMVKRDDDNDNNNNENEENNNNSREDATVELVPDVVLEHAKNVLINDWRRLV